MKSKYFVRGFGVGVLVTSLVYAGVSMVRMNNQKSSPDGSAGKGAVVSEVPLDRDEEESTKAPEGSAAPGVTKAPESSAAPGVTTAPESSAAPNATKAPESSAAPNATTAPEGGLPAEDGTARASASPSAVEQNRPAGGDSVKTPQPEQQITVEIPAGSDSYQVAEKLEEKNLIDDADKFNEYLIGRGYEERLSAGTFQLKKGDTYEQIAQKITDRQK